MARVLTLLIMVFALSFTATETFAARIGVASAVKNQVNGSVAGVIHVGSGVVENEVISTGAESSTQLLFRDETSLTIGPTSRVTLDRFVYNPNTRAGDVVVNVFQGTFRFVSGSAKPGGYTIKTPVATVGLRGTVVEGFINALGELLLVVVEGFVDVTTTNGTTVTLRAGEFITVSRTGEITGPNPWTGRTLDIESGQQFILDTDNPIEEQRDQFNDALDSRDLDVTFPPETTQGRDTIINLKGLSEDSDVRLKRDVRYLDTLESGIRLYAFRYLWSDTVYVGVMAQDLLAHPVFTHAVHLRPNGFFAVDYARLGLNMTTLEQWKAKGIAAAMVDLRQHRAVRQATSAFTGSN